MFVSLGDSCCVRYQIDKHVGKKESYLFDHLVSGFDDMLTVLESAPEDLFSKANVYKKETCAGTGRSNMMFRPLKTLSSLHDVPITYTDADVDRFLATMCRRHHRLTNLIKTQSVTFVHFALYRPVTVSQQARFFEVIQKMSFHTCKLILTTHSETSMETLPEVTSINFADYTTKDTTWQRNKYPWHLVFDI